MYFGPLNRGYTKKVIFKVPQYTRALSFFSLASMRWEYIFSFSFSFSFLFTWSETISPLLCFDAQQRARRW